MKGYSIKSSDWEAIYPIGSIYMSTNSTSPATLFGGTWTQLKDQFLLCAGSTYSAGSTGGSATHVHSTTAIALTEAQLPEHTHKGLYWLDPDNPNYVVTLNTGTYGYHLSWSGQGNTSTNGAGANENSMRVGSTGSGKTHSHGNTGSTSNMPPYLAVYVWKRTA